MNQNLVKTLLDEVSRCSIGIVLIMIGLGILTMYLITRLEHQNRRIEYLYRVIMKNNIKGE
mgnify:CR=1 FL=1